jgi:hypothetical protein
MRLSLQLLLALASLFILRSEYLRTQYHILLFQIRDSSNLEGQVPVLIFPRNRVARLYHQAMGSLSVAFYDTQSYGGGDSNPFPHPGGPVCYVLTHKFESGRIQNTAPNRAFTFCVRIRCRAGMKRSTRVESHVMTDCQ